MAYFSGYGPGTYTVEVVDSNNCSAQDIIIIEEPDELDVTITTSNWNGYEVKCNGDNSGYANISINGGSGPYVKTVYDDNSNLIYNGNSPMINNLSAGIYTFIVTDNNGCSYEEILTYEEPTEITHLFVADSITCFGWSNGAITDVVSGGVGSATTYSYLWNTGDTTYSINNIPAGTYTMTATDQNNCSTTGTISIGNGSILLSSIPLGNELYPVDTISLSCPTITAPIWVLLSFDFFLTSSAILKKYLSHLILYVLFN